MNIHLTACVGTNADLLPRVLALHVPVGSVVADVTFGRGVFWQQVPAGAYTLKATDVTTGVDCRALPHRDAEVGAVVLDPPYIYNPKDSVKASISEPYNVNTTAALRTVQDVVAFYGEAMREAWRVLTPGGKLLVKCQDQIMSNRQYWVHIDIHAHALALGMYPLDLFILVQKTRPAIRWPTQKHARKNHSYLWVFRKDLPK